MTNTQHEQTIELVRQAVADEMEAFRMDDYKVRQAGPWVTITIYDRAGNTFVKAQAKGYLAALQALNRKLSDMEKA